MNEKIKNIISCVSFLLILFGFAIAGLLLPDGDVSAVERRKLKQLPQTDAQSLMSDEYYDKFEKYLLDQFALRDTLRTVKAFNEYRVFAKADSDGVYLCDGYVSKTDYPLDEQSILDTAEQYGYIYDELFAGCDAYYSIIPDKNFFLAEKNGYPCFDYGKLKAIMKENCGYGYIEISDLLSIDNYYRTDLHWRQEAIIPVADRILSAMGKTPPPRNYTYTEYDGYYGSYFGQSALPVSADKLVYANNDVLSSCTLFNHQNGEISGIYEPESIGGIDSYSVFLSGAQALLTVENPANTGTLYIVRDSFASSLAPLLAESYHKIVLIDIRYISPKAVRRYITPESDADVLFILSTTVMNLSNIFKD